MDVPLVVVVGEGEERAEGVGLRLERAVAAQAVDGRVDHRAAEARVDLDGNARHVGHAHAAHVRLQAVLEVQLGRGRVRVRARVRG